VNAPKPKKRRARTKGFRIGDRVVIVRSTVAERIGTVTTVISDLEPAAWIDEPGMDEIPMHTLDLPPLRPGDSVAYPPSHLEPYIDDGNERAEWTAELRRLCGVSEVTP
jgi:hypothetical protein